ncbi:coiled-coil domain-containing protein 13 [Neopelma chrysocephalum]|uniref:coiled-coil domain-containing protein 13 n=1 Tax=Neopelma chrysocephalum TaxID=114329 RepID=UPI000FCD359A|nr:coiled-coil domain-containing protein 13 [Neopelma chrysocephalum]
MESDIKVNQDFKSQFKAYQKQQQRRLQNVMERKKEKQNSQKDDGNTGETLRTPDDLNLFEIGQPVNEDGSKRFLEAGNEQLQDQLREVRDENCRLYKLVTEKDFEIKQLQKKVQEDRLALAGTSGLAGDVAATKIVELAKKNREITAEAESERAKVKQLNHKVKELERELQATVEKIHSLGGGGIKESTRKMLEENLAESPEVKALQEKLNTANLKAMEYRNQLQSSRQELKMTQKLLANEIGEDVNIQSLLANSGSWRGRAQQILVLQNKVRELESKLGQNKTRRSVMDIDEDFLALEDPRRLSAQEKHLLKLRNLEKEKREALEKLAGEHRALQNSHEEVRKKLDATKARNKILCGELKILKAQIVTLLEKGKHDDELIDALLSQQKQMQEILKDLSQKDENKIGQMLNNEIQKQSCLIEQLREMVAERDAKVQMMEQVMGELTLQKESAHQGEGSGAADTPPSEHSEAPLAPGSSEVARTDSARTVFRMGHMLVESAATRPSLRDDIPHGGLPGTDIPEGKVLQTQIPEHRALCQAAEVEKDTLLALVTVLQKRVEESSNKAWEAEKRLQEQQCQSVILEQELEKLQTDPGKNTRGQKPPLRSRTGESVGHSRLPLNVSDRKELPAFPLSQLPLESQVEELSRRLVIQLDENKALQAALESTVRKKEEDFKLYQDTMEHVKKIFLQAIEQQKQEKS